MNEGHASVIEKRLMFAALAVGGAVMLPYVARILPKWGFIFLAVLYGVMILGGLGFAKAWGCLGGLMIGVLLFVATHSAIIAVLAVTVGWMIEVGRAKKAPPQF